MCGICGYYSFHQELSSNNILEMNNAIRHRGPDDEGFWLKDNYNSKAYAGEDSIQEIKNKLPLLPNRFSKLALGFRRLSIIDVSENGHQPMNSDDESCTITFNGEIYNFLVIKAELQRLGHQFHSQSDTEVILKGYLEWGTSIFAKLDGMFAICIVDNKNQKLFLARDRMGLKPLFYTKSSEYLVWASEIKSILKNELIIPKVNWQGVYTNFLFQTTLAPETCFQDIFSLEPASFMTLDLINFKFKKKKYWKFPAENTSIKESDAILKIDELLSESIKDQLQSDVPVASMMSGGIDSTLITTKTKPLDKDINAFTLGYPFAEDEVKNAGLVAKNLDINHHIKVISDDEVLQNLKENIQHFEEPYSSMEILLNAAEYAKNLGFKVVLSGNGADELFAGYSHSLKLNQWLFMRNFGFIRPFIFTNTKFSNRVKNYFSVQTMFDFFRQSQVGMMPHEAKSVFSDSVFSQIKTNCKSYHWSETKDYKGLFEYDMKYSLSSHHVFRDDLSAMKYGVEFRYPYLSNALVDYVSSLPAHFRFNGKQNKPLLRKVAAKYLPTEILNMPKKGFSFPFAHSIEKEEKIRIFIAENLARLKMRGFFDEKVIEQWEKEEKQMYDYAKIWQLVTFELWYQKYFEGE